MFTYWVALGLASLLICGIESAPEPQQQSRQLTTVTRTRTTTTTPVIVVNANTKTICASYVNATTACRRKRQFWIDTPIILSLDDDLDPYTQQFINPSGVFSLEPTVSPIFRDGLKEKPNIQSSVFEQHPIEAYNPYLFRGGYSPFQPIIYGAYPQEGRLGALGLLQLFANLLGVAPTSYTTKTETVFSTSTSYSTSTGVLLISGCSPAGLTYSTCK